MTAPLPIGTETPFGTIIAVGWVGERYYWMRSGRRAIAMIPASLVEVVP